MFGKKYTAIYICVCTRARVYGPKNIATKIFFEKSCKNILCIKNKSLPLQRKLKT